MTTELAQTFALVIAGLVAPWLTEWAKRYQIIEAYHALAGFVISLVLAILAMLITGSLDVSDPQRLAEQASAVFVIATAVYRTIIKPRKALKGKE